MKKRPNIVDSYLDEANDFAMMLNGKDGKTADDRYHEIAIKGISIICFLLHRINDKIAFIIGFLFAILLFRR